jgi:multidrug resistance efflux pump
MRRKSQVARMNDELKFGAPFAPFLRKWAGLIVALILLSVGGYVVVGEHLAGVSANAAVNARLTVLRAPIDGRLSLRVHTIGARVFADETLGRIADVRVDTGRVGELKRTKVALQADLVRVNRRVHLITKARDASAAYGEEYRQGRIDQLRARLAESKAVIDAASARLREKTGALERAKALSARGVQTAANLDRAQAGYDVAVEDLKVAKQKQAYLEVEMKAAKSGAFLSGSHSDVPYSLQRVRELELRLADTKTEAEHARRRIAEVNEQIAAEQLNLHRRAAAEIRAPTPGIIWDFIVNDGEIVRKGQDLLRMVDCNSVIISASVSERLYNTLKLGDPAQFRLLSDSRVFPATITRLAGSGAAGRYENLAVGPTKEHLKRYDVTLIVPSLALEPDVKCAVGRTGRVVFSSSASDFFDRFRTQLGL